MKSRMWQVFVLMLLVCISYDHIWSGASKGMRKPASLFPVQVGAGWNLMSLPVQPPDIRKNVIYPSAATPAYTYEEAYVAKDSLEAGRGYWMKFSSPQTIYVDGDTVLDQSVPLRAGWNMIGSLSVPMPVANIYTEPASIVTSKYFRYTAVGGYQEADTLLPGEGYWIKSTQDGVLYLTAPGGAEGSITDADRQVAFDSITAFVNRLPHTDNAADNLALLAYLRSSPLFEAADTMMNGVWARFTDGRLFLRANDMPRGDSLGSLPGGMAPLLPEQPEKLASPTDNLPTESTAWVCNAMGSFFENLPGGGVTQTANELKQYFQLAGYTLAPNAGASIGDLKSVKDVGAFYISAHGSGVYDRDSNLLYGVWTSNVQDIYYDMVFRRDLRDGNLAYFSAPDLDDGSPEGYERIHYAFTERFVKKYMSFAGGAAVFMNSCWSHYEGNMAQACKLNGAGFYVGWSRSVEGTRALRAARHFLDRMLGTNQYNPEIPPQRPFDADLVWNDLILKGYNTSPGGCTITIDPTIPNVNLLAPSILNAYQLPIPGADDFYIDGLFGDNLGPAGIKVTVGGAPITLREWVNSTKLRLDPPTQGGDVQVTVLGRTSNVTQYTEWHAVFEYTLHGRGSLKQHILMHVDFLADVHSFRINIADAPIFTYPRYIQVLNTSHADYDCSGEYRDPNDTSAVVEYWAGTGSVPIGTDYLFTSQIGPPNNQNQAVLAFTATYTVNGSETPLNLPSDVSYPMLMMNSSYTVGGGTLDGSNDLGVYSLTWSDVVPTHKPSPTSAR